MEVEKSVSMIVDGSKFRLEIPRFVINKNDRDWSGTWIEWDSTNAGNRVPHDFSTLPRRRLPNNSQLPCQKVPAKNGG